MTGERTAPVPAVAWAVVAIVAGHGGWHAGKAVGGRSAVLVAVAIAAVVLLVARLRPSGPTVVVAIVIGVGFGSFARAAVQDTGPLARLARDGGATVVDVTVVTEPATTPDGWWVLGRVGHSGERVLLRGREEPPVLGSRWRGETTARPLEHEGFEGWLRRRHAVAVLSATSWEPAAGPGLVGRSTERVRQRVREAASAGLADRTAGLAVGLVTGDTRLLDEDTEDRMQAAGLTHLVAVSGSNVAVVAAGAVLLAGALGLGARGQRWLVAVTIAWFVVLTRAEPSVSRAAVMAAAVLIARARGTPTSSVHALGVAVLVLVTIDPFLAMSVGLLLSAGATAGVLVVAPLVQRRLARLPRPLAVVLATTLGAQLAVAPILLATFGEVPLGSIPANLVAVPAAAVASVVVSFGSVVAVLHVPSAAAVFSLAALPLHGVLWAADRFSSGAVISTAAPLALFAAAAAGAALVLRPGTRPARGAAWSAAVATAVVLLPGLVPLSTGLPSVLTVTAIDVGQGDAILVEGGGVRILVDVGGDDTAGRWLRRRRVGVDLLVLSHPHADHVGGIDQVLGHVSVGVLWYRPVPEHADEEDRIGPAASARDIRVFAPQAGQRAMVGELAVDILAPPAGRPYRGSDRELNDTSLVLRVSHDGRSVLLTGDVEVAGQQDLLRRPDLLRAGLLKVPHHGGATSLPEFFAATGASDAIISAGKDNDYGHPHPDVLEQLQGLGMRVHRTDIAGTVRLTVPRTSAVVGAVTRSAGLATQAVLASGLGWRDAQRSPDRRRRRPAPASRDRATARPGQGRPSRHRGRPLRGRRARPPPRDADSLALRRRPLSGAPRRAGRAW